MAFCLSNANKVLIASEFRSPGDWISEAIQPNFLADRGASHVRAVKDFRMKTDSTRLIEIALGLFRTKGYKRTSMAEIASEAGLLKGSVYHHFPDKEHLLIGGVQYIADVFEREVIGPSRDPGRSEKERLDAMVDATLTYYLKHRDCAFVQLWPDLVHESEEARRIVEGFYRSWQNAIAQLLVSKHGAAKAKRMAATAIAKVQGGVVWLQIMGDSAPLKQMASELRDMA